MGALSTNPESLESDKGDNKSDYEISSQGSNHGNSIKKKRSS